MRARILDPAGPRWTRYAPFLAGCACLVLACLFPPAAASLLFAMSILWHLSPLLVRRRSMRWAELRLGGGSVSVTHAGVLRQRIRARDLEGATTARVEDGVALTLMRRDRDGHAMELVVANDEEAHRVREALGIGHHGFGALRWPTEPKHAYRFEMPARLTGAAMTLAVMALLFLWPNHGGMYLMPLAALIVLGTSTLIAASTLEGGAGPQILMRPDGLHTWHGPRSRVIPYSYIAGVRHDASTLTIELHGGPPVRVPIRRPRFTHRGFSDDELRMLTAQILSAAQRAQGAGPAKPEVATRVDVLARGAEPPAKWLARVDAAAAGVSGAGYRGGAIDEGDLWRTLLDPDADASLRAGAARVLVRVAPDTAPSRIESAIAAVRDPNDAKRIRVALLPDVEEAGRELEELDRKSMHLRR